MIIFTDIDDTLMKTKRKISNIDTCKIGAYSESGNVLSYIDNTRLDFIESFVKKHIFIPVTARSFSALKRVQLSFDYEKVINFGAHILNNDNSLNEEWNLSILQNQINAQILEKAEFIKNKFIIPTPIELIERIEFNSFIFLNFRNSLLNLEDNKVFANNLSQFLIMNNIYDFYFYITDRDVTLIPQYIKKEFAVDFLLKKYSDLTSIGIGDHKNDFSFMQLCDFSIFPNDSSLSKLLKELS